MTRWKSINEKLTLIRHWYSSYMSVLILCGMKKYWKLFSGIEWCSVVLKQTWFQQDRATPNATNSVIRCLKQKCGYCFLAQGAAFSWSSWSHNLTLCDLFMWGYLKANIFLTPVPDLLTLKSRIQAEIGKIRKEMLQRVYENALALFQISIGNDGHYLPNVILK